ncbi:MAG: hypothetical protein AAFU57_14825 [Bacteroidota bacterium]
MKTVFISFGFLFALCSNSYAQNLTGQWIVSEDKYAGLSYTLVETEDGLWMKSNDEIIPNQASFYAKLNEHQYASEEQNHTLSILDDDQIQKTTLPNGETKNSILFTKVNDATEPASDAVASSIAWRLEQNYPMEVKGWNSSMIYQESFIFRNVTVNLSYEGKLTIKGGQSTFRFRGFTGRLFVDLIDKEDNTIARVYFKAQEVSPEIGIGGSMEGTIKYEDVQTLNFEKYPEILIATTRLSLGAERTDKGREIIYNEMVLNQISKDMERNGISLSSSTQRP